MRFRRHQEAAERSTLHLLLGFALVVAGLVLAVNGVLALVYWLTFPFASGLPTAFVATNTALVLLFVLGGCAVESARLKEGGPHVAALAGARPAQPSGHDEHARRERRFVHVVQEMALASGQRPPPQAWVLPRDDAINALAAGWAADDAVVVVTRGALERLTRAELQGVVAHEFSHLVHGDTRLNMRLVGLVWGLQMVWGLGVQLWTTDDQGRRNAGALFGLGLMAVGSLGWVAGRLLQAAVSRQREFLADASAVKFARHVDGLGGALRKIADQQVRHVAALSSAHAASLAHLLLSNGGLHAVGRWRALLATHPPLGERLARLYGKPLAADEMLLAADAVALDGDDDVADPGVSRLAGGAALVSLRNDGSLEAEHHDSTQMPAFHGAAEREREALERIGRWHGPGEWQAAMVALSLERTAVRLRGRLYPDVTADLSVAPAVQAEVAALGDAARRHVFALLLARAAALPHRSRRRLWREWATRWRALHGDAAREPRHAWRALVIRRALTPLAQRSTRGTLSTQASAVLAATRLLSRTLALAPEAAVQWRTRAIDSLRAAGLPAPRGPAAGLAPPHGARELHCALRVRHLSPMQRPLLLRAWLDALPSMPDAATLDALHLAFVALDVPVPARLAAGPVQPSSV